MSHKVQFILLYSLCTEAFFANVSFYRCLNTLLGPCFLLLLTPSSRMLRECGKSHASGSGVPDKCNKIRFTVWANCWGKLTDIISSLMNGHYSIYKTAAFDQLIQDFLTERVKVFCSIAQNHTQLKERKPLLLRFGEWGSPSMHGFGYVLPQNSGTPSYELRMLLSHCCVRQTC